MGSLKIGIIPGCFRLGPKAGIVEAGKLGVEGIQLFITAGETAPENLSESGRRELVKLVKDNGMVFASTCGDIGGFSKKDTVEQIVERSKLMIDLTLDLGTTIMTTHIGTVPEDKSDEVWKTMKWGLTEVGTYAAEKNACVAAETGPEEPAVLLGLLDDINCEGVKVNYDPANLNFMGFDHLAGVSVLGKYIVHTHAKETIHMQDGSYNEVALGKGDIKWPQYVAALQEQGFNGFYTIEREVGDNPAADIATAVKMLRGL